MLKKEKSLDSVTRTFLELEEELDLLNWEIEGYSVWIYERLNTFNSICYYLDLLSTPHNKKQRFADRLTYLKFILNSLTSQNPYTTPPNRLLLFDHDRKKKINGQWIDIYSEYHVTDWVNKKVSFEVLERPYNNVHLTKSTPYRKHADVVVFRAFIDRILSSATFKPEDLAIIDAIEKKIKDTTSVKLSLKKQFRKSFLEFKFKNDHYRKLLEYKQPDKIYVVVSYAYFPLILAAKSLNIPVIEIQHGVIDKMHMGYNYPEGRYLVNRYIPDLIQVWGKYWQEVLPANWKSTIYGFPFFNEKKEKYKTIEKELNKVLIISQGSIGNQLAELLPNFLQNNPDYHFIYKFHPSEYEIWKNYPAIKELMNTPNVSFIDDNTDLYYLMAKSHFVVGVYSTALYEAIAFGCKLILANLPGLEYLTHLRNKHDIPLLDKKNLPDLNAYQDTLKINEKDFFWK